MMHSENRLLTLATYLFFVMIYIQDTIPHGQILTLASLIMMIVSCWDHEKKTFYVPVRSGFLIYMVIFLLFCASSMLWAEDTSLTFNAVRQLLTAIIEIAVLYCCYHSRSDNPVSSLLDIATNGGYIVLTYLLLKYGWSTIIKMLSDEERAGNSEIINLNTLGMCAAYAIVINMYFILYEGTRIRDLLIIPAAVMIAFSGSRKAIVIVVAGVLMVIVFKNWKKEDPVNSVLKGLFFLALGVIVILLVYYLPVFNMLRTRLEGLWYGISGSSGADGSTSIRLFYDEIGLDLFAQKPVLGIGINNAGVYMRRYYGHPHLHNNFIELLACGGIIGFAVHYSIYVYLFYNFWKLRRYRTKEYDICLIILVIRFVMGYGHIQYYQTITYYYLMIMILFVMWMKRETGGIADGTGQM